MFARSLVLSLFVVAAPAIAQGNPGAQAVPHAPQPLPRATFIDNMNSNFSHIDANHDGMLSKQEIENWQRANEMQQIMARNHAIFVQLDTNHDGVLSPEEFAQFHSEPAPPNAAPMLQRFDANHDGVISIVEFRAGTLANFDRLDTNHDGVVDAAEMRAGGIAQH